MTAHRFQEASAAALVLKSVAVRAQLEEVAAVFVSGCPDADCNGRFFRVVAEEAEPQMQSTEGMPCFKSQRGKCLFYLEAAGQWAIHSVVTEVFDTVEVCNRRLGTSSLLPTGTAQWECRPMRNAGATSHDGGDAPPTEPPPPDDPPGVDRSNPRTWCKRGAMASLDGRVGEVTMDPDGDSDVKLRIDGDTTSYININRLEYVPTPSATGSAAAESEDLPLQQEGKTHELHSVTVSVLSPQDLLRADICMLEPYSGTVSAEPHLAAAFYGIAETTGLVAEIFGYYDADADQTLSRDEYQSFMQGIAYYGVTPGTSKACTDSRYDECGWPEECKALECDPAVGIPWAAFAGKLYGEYRKSQLRADLAAAREHQAQVRGESPATFDAEGKLPTGWKTKMDPQRKRRFYYNREAGASSTWQRPGSTSSARGGEAPRDSPEQEAAARRERERTQATQVRAVVAPVGYRRQRGLLDSGSACQWRALLPPRAFL